MTIKIRDLLTIADASTKHKTEQKDILFDALEGKLSLYVISDKDCREALIPCRSGSLHHSAPGEFIDQFQPLLDHVHYIDVELGQPLILNKTAIKQLIVNHAFSQAELFRELAPEVEDLDINLWKTEREVYDWLEDVPAHASILLDQVCLAERDLTGLIAESHVAKNSSPSKASNTSLKVIGLFMHHLAKTSKYAAGSSPNKSQIKQLLLDLAEELDVDPYGLSKVDERLLADAMKYLEEQKL